MHERVSDLCFKAAAMPKRLAKGAKCIPRMGFTNIVKEISARTNPDIRWGRLALDGLQNEAEEYLTLRFSKARDLAGLFGHRVVTLKHFRGKSDDVVAEVNNGEQDADDDDDDDEEFCVDEEDSD